MRFGIHHSSWLDAPDPGETFETVTAKAQTLEGDANAAPHLDVTAL
jgi:hypothetical protein